MQEALDYCMAFTLGLGRLDDLAHPAGLHRAIVQEAGTKMGVVTDWMST